MDKGTLVSPCPRISTNNKTFSTTILYVTSSGSCGGKTPCYSTIQTAVDAASSGASINIADGNYLEDISLSTSKNLTFQGGWDSSFTTQSGNSRVNSVTITNGTATFENIVIQ